MSDVDNTRRWTDDTRGVYEVWYLTWNDPRTGQGFWLRHVEEAPQAGARYFELWFARFDPARTERTFGVHKRFATRAACGAQLDDGHAVGTLDGGGHQIAWNLAWDPAPQTMRLLPDLVYGGGGRGETTVLSPNPRVRTTGTLQIDGETMTLDDAVLGQSHVWGKKHAYSWAWGRCAEFAGADDALLEVFCGRLQRRGITLPPVTLVYLELEGERYRLNQFRHLVANRGRWQTGRVEFKGWSPAATVTGELTCIPERLIIAPYCDPDGTDVFCANTEIGDARIVVQRRGRAPRELISQGRAHFETGSRMRDPAVVHEHVLV